VGLATAAAVTSTLKVATGICLVAQRDPIVLAKEVASLDFVSNGRFLFGIGVGWNRDEMENHGVDPARRRALARENVLAMKALWTEDEASYAGEYVQIEPSWAWPKPAQQPHPSIVLGGAAGPKTAQHVAEFCDGWMPLVRAGTADLAKKLTTLRERVAKAGRDPKSLDVSVFGVRPQKPIVDELAAAGVTRAIFMIPSEPRDAALSKLDGLVALTK
jgi:probable F420-dependent oxidoreductase